MEPSITATREIDVLVHRVSLDTYAEVASNLRVVYIELVMLESCKLT